MSKCTKGNELQVLSAFPGFYVGTLDSEGPCCTISNFFKSRRDAEIGMMLGDKKVHSEGNQFSCPGCMMYPLENKLVITPAADMAIAVMTTTRTTKYEVIDKILAGASLDKKTYKVRYNKVTYNFQIITDSFRSIITLLQDITV